MSMRGLRNPVAMAALMVMLAAGARAGGPSVDLARQEAQTTDQLIIKYRDSSSRSGADLRIAQAGQRAGIGLTHKRDMFHGGRVMKLDRAMTVAQIRTLGADLMAGDPEIESVEADIRLYPQLVPSDTSFGTQWHYYEAVAGINLPAAWDRSTGTGVYVAVIDTGYRPHADLAANIVGGYDLIASTTVSNDGNARDSDAKDPGDWCGTGSSSWHGTHVAGTIAAVTNNATGVAGVAHGAKVVPVRVLGTCGGSLSDVADGIVWASGGTVTGLPANAYPARVLNLSLGGSASSCGTTMQAAVNSARSRNTVVVVAAGNANAYASTQTPANCTGVVAVGAVDRTGARASFSNYGSLVDVAAPGVSVLSTLNSGATVPGADAYASYAGTSMATPHVAGVVALMLSKNSTLTPDQVETMLKGSARPFPVTPDSIKTIGAGIVDAKKAVDTAMGSLPTAVTEVESNNTLGTAQTVSAAHAAVSGTLSATTDTDYYKVSVAAGKVLSATLNMAVSTQNYQLYLYNSAGTQVAASLNGTGLPETVKVTNSTTAAATYYARVVYGAGGTGTAGGKYLLNLLQQ